MEPEQGRWFVTNRAFRWGILIVGDAASTDLPSRIGDRPVGSSDSVVVIGVRHASDVDDPDDGEFLVRLHLMLGADAKKPCFDGSILVSAGQLSVGDADHEELLPIAPGRWRLQIETAPADHPEQVTIWVSPSHGDEVG